MYGLAAWREQRYAEAAARLVEDLTVRAVAAAHAVRLALNALATGGDKLQTIAALRATLLGFSWERCRSALTNAVSA